ncbi:hypothetical protein RIF29_29195 [Crotalaria pallida]|uniref:Uncharacterized protein n=1 Tax=Crotalaria pallida TaxID=3830 RepID=A0AAN9I054_CROPI
MPFSLSIAAIEAFLPFPLSLALRVSRVWMRESASLALKLSIPAMSSSSRTDRSRDAKDFAGSKCSSSGRLRDDGDGVLVAEALPFFFAILTAAWRLVYAYHNHVVRHSSLEEEVALNFY